MDFGNAEDTNGVRPIQSPHGDRPNKYLRAGGLIAAPQTAARIFEQQ